MVRLEEKQEKTSYDCLTVVDDNGQSLTLSVIADQVLGKGVQVSFSAMNSYAPVMNVDECRSFLSALQMSTPSETRIHPLYGEGLSLDLYIKGRGYSGWGVDHHAMFEMGDLDRSLLEAFLKKFVLREFRRDRAVTSMGYY